MYIVYILLHILYINNIRMAADARKSIVPTEEAAAAARSRYIMRARVCVCARTYRYT